MVVDIRTRVVASCSPPSIKEIGATGSKLKPYSPSDYSEEEVVGVDITMVVSVTIFIRSVVNEILLEAEVLKSFDIKNLEEATDKYSYLFTVRKLT